MQQVLGSEVRWVLGPEMQWAFGLSRLHVPSIFTTEGNISSIPRVSKSIPQKDITWSLFSFQETPHPENFRQIRTCYILAFVQRSFKACLAELSSEM